MIPLRKFNILVVDDNSMDRLITKSILQKLGLKSLQEAENGSIAAGKLETAHEIGKPYDIVFMDWNMPSSSGLKLLQIVQKDPKLRQTKIIVMTATSDPSVVEDAIENGASDFIVKPVTIEVVKEKLDKMIWV